MRHEFVVLAANLAVVGLQVAMVGLARLVDAIFNKDGRSNSERAYLANRKSRRKRGEQTGGRSNWTSPVNDPSLAGNATRWSSSVPDAR